MSFVARCPNCERETLAPDEGIGRGVRCHGCDTQFVLVPELAVTPAARWSPAGIGPPTAAPRPDPSTDSEAVKVAEATDAPAHSQTPTEPTPALPDAARSPRGRPAPAADSAPALGYLPWTFAGMACLAAVLAGVSASVTSLAGLLLPSALAGVVLGAAALVAMVGRESGPLEFAVPAVPTAGSAVLLLLALFAPDFLSPQYGASRQRAEDDPNAIRTVPLGGELVPPDQLGSPDAGVDAGRFALQRGNLRVRVTAVSFGPVQLEGKDGKKPTPSKERYLAVELAFQHLGHGEAVTILPWGSNTPRPVPEPRLTAGGKEIQLAAKGRATGDLTVPPGGTVAVRLLFPEGQLAEPLTLALPTDAWGQAGVFRFRIPAGMVRGGLPKGKG